MGFIEFQNTKQQIAFYWINKGNQLITCPYANPYPTFISNDKFLMLIGGFGIEDFREIGDGAWLDKS